MCRVRSEFQSFRITFGKVTSTAGASDDREDDGAIQALQEVAEQNPDIAEAARYSRITGCQIHRDILCLARHGCAPQPSKQLSSWMQLSASGCRMFLLHAVWRTVQGK